MISVNALQHTRDIEAGKKKHAGELIRPGRFAHVHGELVLVASRANSSVLLAR